MGVNEILNVCRLPHQPSHAVDDVSTSIFDRAWVIVIPSHILESESFPLHVRLIMRHGTHERLDSIPIFEA
jgi:hypothetical protein